MTRKSQSRFFSFMVCMLASPIVTATEGRVVNGVNIKTDVGLEVGHNDNLLKAERSSDEVATEYAILSPQISLAISPKDNYFAVRYRLSAGEYFSSKDDNFIDHDLSSNNLIRLSLRNAIKLDLKYKYQHEERGSSITAGSRNRYDEPLEYSDTSARATYIYGAPSAKGKLSLFAQWHKLKYQNFRNIDDIAIGYSTRFNDYDDISTGVEFINAWRRNAKLVLSYIYNNKNYDYLRSGELRKDSYNHLLYAGLDWDLVEKTNGYIRLGVQDKNFKDGGREDFTGFSWLVGANWKPVNHSNIRLETSQITKDPDQDGDYLRQTVYSLNWKHFWHSQIYSDVGIDYTQDDYTGAYQNGVLREEDLTKYKLALGYEFSRNIDTHLRLTVSDKESSWDLYGYDQNLWSLIVKVKF
ncbi:outer membrane beta-barrel protein [Vibrio hippocampi]|uniref:Capsular polysaccharide synthesis enzyme CpsB n=1 Tax=Vibrio hippocampi TaxID=654686 RepID=A0ABN8DH92_9VIBR|nr:outer membrane beta-barrel protein [Vibrio hippocampi]CAH0526165.1 hypothetical protein VHP8226_01639 [Vibrio hippocampi]